MTSKSKRLCNLVASALAGKGSVEQDAFEQLMTLARRAEADNAAHRRMLRLSRLELLAVGAGVEASIIKEHLKRRHPGTALLKQQVAESRDAALEEAAKLARGMVVGGRAWTHDQQVAADALLACADAIDALKSPQP